MNTTETRLNGVSIPKDKDEFVLLKDLQPGDAFKAYGTSTYVKLKGTYQNNIATVDLNSMQLTWMDPDRKIPVKDLIEYLEINTTRPYVNIPYIKWPDDYNRPNNPPYPWYTIIDTESKDWPKTTQPPERQFTYCNSQLKSTADLDMKDHMTWAVNRKD